jgi:hypothetical protein
VHTVHMSGHAVSSPTLKRQLSCAGSGFCPMGDPATAHTRARLALRFDVAASHRSFFKSRSG